jgi:hypothetical protein
MLNFVSVKYLKMIMKVDLYRVSKAQFEDYLKDKKVTKMQGSSMHSTFYVDEVTGVALGYIETSSYGDVTRYMINEADGNFEATELVTNILNKL